MKPPLDRLVLSSMWLQRWPDGSHTPEFVALVGAMGFAGVELGPVVTAEGLAQLPAATRVASVHHPCPGPGAKAQFTAVRPRERLLAAESLLASLKLAARLGAGQVVFHLGAIPGSEPAIDRAWFELVSRHRAGLGDTSEADLARRALSRAAARAEAACLPLAIDALRPVVAAAAELGVGLAWETGYHPHELPTPAGAARLLLELPTLGAWLDTGHVGARAALGVDTLADWRGAVGERWLGAHIHDLVGLRDHLPPGCGELPLEQYLAELPKQAALTLELDWYFTPAEVGAGAAAVRALMERLEL